MRLATKLGVAFGVLVTLLAGLAFYQLSLVQRLHDEIRQLSSINFRALEISLETRGRIDRLREFSHKLALLRDPAYSERTGRLRQAIAQDLRVLGELEMSAAESSALNALSRDWRSYLAWISEREDQILAGQGDAAAFRTSVESDLGAVADGLAALMAASRTAIAEAVATGRLRAEQGREVARLATGLALAAAALLSVLIVIPIARGVAHLMRGTRELAAGRFDHRVSPGGGPELSALATSFNEMAEQLGQLDDLKKQLVATVSHDLKAPLASIQESLTALLEGLAGPLSPDQERLLRRNLASAQRLSRMISDLLDLARLDAGVRRFELRPRDLGQLAAEVVDELHPLAAEKRLAVRLRLPRAEVIAQCDADGIRQVLQNLLANAIEFTPPEGEIGVRVRPIRVARELPFTSPFLRPAGVLLEVWDTGPGVPDPLKERIFDRFVHGGTGSSSTGLGLAIARAIAEAHGGRVWVRDRSGPGASFLLFLPTQPEKVPFDAEALPNPVVERSS